MLSEAERRLRASVGGYALSASHDSAVTSAPGRAAAFRKFVDQVDPDGELTKRERFRRAKALQSSHMQRLALAREQARRKAGSSE